tara:strand:- start:373 stop:498 length:126 start_codon:yes stop_codon:yes gene_type:complete
MLGVERVFCVVFPTPVKSSLLHKSGILFTPITGATKKESKK